MASLIAELVITVLYFRFCNGYLTADTLLREGWKKLIAGIVMFAVIKAIDRFIASDLIALLVEMAVGFSVYCIMILALRDTFITEIVFGKILKKKRSAS